MTDYTPLSDEDVNQLIEIFSKRIETLATREDFRAASQEIDLLTQDFRNYNAITNAHLALLEAKTRREMQLRNAHTTDTNGNVLIMDHSPWRR